VAKTAQEVVNMAKATLQESGTGTFWTETELLGYLNDGQREIVSLKPDANTVRALPQLAAGTRQTLPAGSICLVALPRNMSLGDEWDDENVWDDTRTWTDSQTEPTGLIGGTAILKISRKVLDVVLPNWHKAEPSKVVEFYCFDERDPKTFYVYPPQPASGQGYAEQVRVDNPTDCASLEAPIALGDEYVNPLYLFMLHKAYAKETEEASPERAAGYKQAFLQGLGIQAEAKKQATRRPAPDES
jgi:hypothetical protein